MSFDLLLSNISRHISLTSEETEFFISLLHSKSLEAGTFLLREGEVCRYENFVSKGYLKTYYLDENGVEHIVDFLIEGWWADDQYSFFTGTASAWNIKAMERTDIIQISKSKLELLYQMVPKFERFFRILFQNAYIAQRDQINSMLSASAEERYILFLKNKPYAEKRFSQKDIASYLGFTPQFLSTQGKKDRWVLRTTVVIILQTSRKKSENEMSITKTDRPALILIDIQKGFDNINYWGGQRNHPNAEENASVLLQFWRENNLPVFHIKHCSSNPASPLNEKNEGNEFKDLVKPLNNEPVIKKNVNSAFIGTTLQEQLNKAKITKLILAGLTTDHCVSTTARMAANFGFDTFIVSDATATFNKKGLKNQNYSAELIHETALASLNKEFATIVTMNFLKQL